MPHRPLSAFALATLAAVLAGALPAGAAVPADLCTGNPCVVTKSVTLDPGTALDFGSDTALVLAPASALTAGGGANGDVALRAGSIVLQPGAAITGGGATIALRAVAGRIELQRNGGTTARIDVSANVAGAITLDA
ncbi:hypothetical protein K2Z84_27390, partial [Candidatus Binatia bacterium]|nr:hypothetical protein [Candidatus Binatia bacterium]